MQAFKKQKLSGRPEFVVSQVVETAKNVNVVGIPISLSDIRCPKTKYMFSGLLGDEEDSMWFISFNLELHDAIKDAYRTSKAVTLNNVDIREFQGQLQILLQDCSTVTSSDNTMKVKKSWAVTKLDGIDWTDCDRLNTIEVKVLRKIREDDMKTTFVIADSSGKANLTAWRNDVKRIVIGNSVKLTDVKCKVYQSCREVNITTFTSVENLKQLDVEAIVIPEDKNRKLTGGVIGVLELKCWKSCRICGSKMNASGNDELYLNCSSSRCDAWIMASKCPITMNMVVDMEPNNGTSLILTVQDVAVLQEAGIEVDNNTMKKDMAHTLSKLAPAIFTITDNNIVTKIEQPDTAGDDNNLTKTPTTSKRAGKPFAGTSHEKKSKRHLQKKFEDAR